MNNGELDQPYWSWYDNFRGTLNKMCDDMVHIGELTKRVGVDDPRRVVHSLKVGLAITLVSLFYYFDTLNEGFGYNAMWSVITVVVVLEFSVGNFTLTYIIYFIPSKSLILFIYINFFLFCNEYELKFFLKIILKIEITFTCIFFLFKFI